jgi:hypothetical protein
MPQCRPVVEEVADGDRPEPEDRLGEERAPEELPLRQEVDGAAGRKAHDERVERGEVVGCEEQAAAAGDPLGAVRDRAGSEARERGNDDQPREPPGAHGVAPPEPVHPEAPDEG